MLRRVASHRIPPPVLDFLVPSLASHPRILARAPLSHDGHPSTPLRSYATSSTATVTPSTVSDWLDKNRHVFMSDAPASLTDSQGEVELLGKWSPLEHDELHEEMILVLSFPRNCPYC